MAEFQIRKDVFTKFRIVETAPAAAGGDLAEGQIRAKIERFGFTANNVTYAVAGDRIGYWKFFPATGTDTDGWGMMPVWGFATVTESMVTDVPVGDRLFGYFPPATSLDLTPVRITGQRFIDGTAHRVELPPAYNNYSRVNGEPGYDPAMDNERMLLWPLHITSFCLWDALQDNDWYGAQQVLVVSASSKTSIGLAYALDDDKMAPPAIAITSARNLDFVNTLGLYQQSVTYDTLDDIDTSIPTVIVDMSGSSDVLGRLHTSLGDNMLRCLNVGLTHWNETRSGSGMIRERSEFFFAPGHIQKRVQDWGPAGFAERTSNFLQRTARNSRKWLKIRKINGLHGLAEIYVDVCEGRVAADEGLVVEL